MRAAAGAMALLFIFGASLQYNDPDPLAWVAVYLAATGVSIACVLRKPHAGASLMLALVALIWAALLAPGALAGADSFHMFDEWEMKDVHVEVAREFWGLVIIMVWSLALGWVEVRRARRAPAS
jgi:hypothetical protein